MSFPPVFSGKHHAFPVFFSFIISFEQFSNLQINSFSNQIIFCKFKGFKSMNTMLKMPNPINSLKIRWRILYVVLEWDFQSGKMSNKLSPALKRKKYFMYPVALSVHINTDQMAVSIINRVRICLVFFSP